MFRCEEILRNPRWILEVFGCWPVRKPTKTYTIKMLAASAFTLAFPAMLCVEILFAYKNYNTLMQILNFLIPYVYVLCKYTIFTFQQNKLFALLNWTNSKIFNQSFVDGDKILRSAYDVVVMVTKVFRFTLALALSMIALLPLSETKLYPVPISHDLGSYSILMYVFQITCLGIGGWLCIGYDCGFIAFTAIGIAQIDILKLRLSSVIQDLGLNQDAFSNSSNVEQLKMQTKIKETLKACIIQHLAIQEYCKRLNNLFSTTIFIQYLMSILALAITMSRILTITELSVKILELAFILMFIFTQLITYSWSGNQIMIKSSDIGEACYMGQWYYYDVSNRKILFFIMERAKRLLYIKASMFAKTTLATCINILRCTYSIFTILRMTYHEN
uniref:Odorant receptor n=1 Tax=Holotrichia parallela TaxID=93412 RepID=A0A2P9JY56_HOLPA|nr:odorant receptor 16 [Holotrichia parallela]